MLLPCPKQSVRQVGRQVVPSSCSKLRLHLCTTIGPLTKIYGARQRQLQNQRWPVIQTLKALAWLFPPSSSMSRSSTADVKASHVCALPSLWLFFPLTACPLHIYTVLHMQHKPSTGDLEMLRADAILFQPGQDHDQYQRLPVHLGPSPILWFNSFSSC